MDTLKNTSVFNDITLLDDNEDYHMISMDEVEEKEIQWLNGICWQGRYFVLAFIFDDKK